MNTLRAETVDETGACYSALSETRSLYSHSTAEREKETRRRAALTCYFQRGIVAHCLSQVVAGNADVGTFVRLAPSSVDDAQEEKGATGQQHALGAGIVPVCFHPLTIFVPLHCWSWPPLRLTVERGRLPFGYDQVRWVLYNPRWGVLLAQPRS